MTLLCGLVFVVKLYLGGALITIPFMIYDYNQFMKKYPNSSLIISKSSIVITSMLICPVYWIEKMQGIWY